MFGNIIKSLFGQKAPSQDEFQTSMSLDVSGSEFCDLLPSREDYKEALNKTGFFRQEKLDWAVSALYPSAGDPGSSFQSVFRALVRSGEPLTKEQKRLLKINQNRLVGDQFIESLLVNDITSAIDRLEVVLHATKSKANMLHNLRRMEEAEVTHVVFMSANDERSTPLEKKLEGKRMTIAETRKLILEHGEEIRRSAFRGEVHF